MHMALGVVLHVQSVRLCLCPLLPFLLVLVLLNVTQETGDWWHK